MLCLDVCLPLRFIIHITDESLIVFQTLCLHMHSALIKSETLVKSKQITVAVKKLGRALQHQSGREGTVPSPNFSLHPTCLGAPVHVGSGFSDMSGL